MPEQEKTIGEQRLRTANRKDSVSHIKQKTAELINLCEELKTKDERLASLAQTVYEEAAMWAVNLVRKKNKPNTREYSRKQKLKLKKKQKRIEKLKKKLLRLIFS
jgi:hypothetical protein